MPNNPADKPVINAIRRAVGKYPTQKDAAEAFDMSPQRLSEMLAGKREIPEAAANLVGWKRQVAWVPLNDGEVDE